MDEPQTGAIRMIAFGVIEYVPVPLDEPMHKRERDAMISKEIEVQALVEKEFELLGWKIMRSVNKFGSTSWRKFILLGVRQGSQALPTRPKIGEGTLQECCLAAVKFIDSDL